MEFHIATNKEGLVTESKNAYKPIRVFYKYSVPAACFGQFYGHPQLGALRRIYYKSKKKANQSLYRPGQALGFPGD
jgi:hypothetical protein